MIFQDTVNLEKDKSKQTTMDLHQRAVILFCLKQKSAIQKKYHVCDVMQSLQKDKLLKT